MWQPWHVFKCVPRWEKATRLALSFHAACSVRSAETQEQNKTNVLWVQRCMVDPEKQNKMYLLMVHGNSQHRLDTISGTFTSKQTGKKQKKCSGFVPNIHKSAPPCAFKLMI